jgi:uncharacterized lipoprotein YajG
MPHKFFELHAIKIHTHKTLVEALYIKCEHTNTSVNTQIHTEIIVNIYMQAYTGNTHKNKHSYNRTYDNP